MKKKIITMLAIGFLVSCGGGNGWSKADKDTFMNDCNSDGSMKAYCECVLNKITKNYGPNDVVPYDDLYEYIEDCSYKL
tara:strand:+ start:797 stop:1033 length:237 start_codon:yes stop_codon:yes gene_type:complete